MGWALAAPTDDNLRVLTDTRERLRATFDTNSDELVLHTRFDIQLRSERTQFAGRKLWWYEVLDAYKDVLYKTDYLCDPEPGATHHAAEVFNYERQRIWQEARDWLKKHYPEWEDPTRCWD